MVSDKMMEEKHVLRILLVVLGSLFVLNSSMMEDSVSKKRAFHPSEVKEELNASQLVQVKNNTELIMEEVDALKGQLQVDLEERKQLSLKIEELTSQLVTQAKAAEEEAKTKQAEPVQDKQDAKSTVPEAPLTHPKWCPDAKCHNTALCKPCQRRFLIVITSPRSASTTLTWMLNTLPGVTMSGENNNALGHIKEMEDETRYHHLLNHKKKSFNPKLLGAWSHHDFVDQSWSCISQETIRYLNPPLLDKTEQSFLDPDMEAKEIVGFKTIRFFENKKATEEGLQELAKWLNHDFPCARVLVNINSDVEGEVKSLKTNHITVSGGLNPNKVDEATAYVEEHIQQAKRFAEILGPKKAYVLDKEEWTSGDMKYINNAVKWLGFHESCKFKELLEYNTKGMGATKKGLTSHFPDTCKPL